MPIGVWKVWMYLWMYFWNICLPEQSQILAKMSTELCGSTRYSQQWEWVWAWATVDYDSDGKPLTLTPPHLNMFLPSLSCVTQQCDSWHLLGGLICFWFVVGFSTHILKGGREWSQSIDPPPGSPLTCSGCTRAGTPLLGSPLPTSLYASLSPGVCSLKFL